MQIFVGGGETKKKRKQRGNVLPLVFLLPRDRGMFRAGKIIASGSSIRRSMYRSAFGPVGRRR